LIKRLEQEAGYSLVEVMASIILLAIAIIPMAGMFDMGLSSSAKGGNYDKARALANLKMEEAKSLSFAQVRDNFPVNPSAPDVANGGYYDSGWIQGNTVNADFTGSQYRVEKQYMVAPTSTANFSTSSSATSLIRIKVTVTWGSSITYSTYGLVAS
jgi:Tfp pilus assembly protein PilV